ncbi:hypothetical protein, partial [Comamonas testosteroni]|uniref:hypothetical protein n=1 Tax=Comamonas testosteroni TaxID=285 RepID=UPI0012D33355
MALFDKLLKGTPFRGLVIDGFDGYCAYLGVPEDHWVAHMESLEFDCHGNITHRGCGDGDYRPAGWYWYGWDYQHLSDKPLRPSEDMPPEMIRMLEKHPSPGKNWTVEEIEHELIDSAGLCCTSRKADEITPAPDAAM